MKRKRHTPQEIIAKLREAEVELNQGATIEAVSRKLEISEQRFHRWRHLYGGMKGPEMARMKELEKENVRLKKIVAQQAMDIDALKDINRKNWCARRASDGRCTIFATSAATRNAMLAGWCSRRARRSGTRPGWTRKSAASGSACRSWRRSIRVRGIGACRGCCGEKG